MLDCSPQATLGHFLRSRRERLTPEAVGLPTGVRRRSPGLRREEVALLANVSPTWYTSLEQNRRVRPSAEVLDSLAEALRLNLTERRYLYALGAGPPQSVLLDPAPEPEMIEHVCRLMQSGNSLPYPVYAADGLGNLIAWNAPMAEWYDDFSHREGLGRNMTWWLFTDPIARERIVDWERDAREVVARTRFFVGRSRVNHRLEEMLGDLCGRSEEFATWWEAHDVIDQEAHHRVFRHPREGICRMELLVVRPDVCPSVSVVFHLPPARHEVAAARIGLEPAGDMPMS